MSHLEVLDLKQVSRTLCARRKVVVGKLILVKNIRETIDEPDGDREPLKVSGKFFSKWFTHYSLIGLDDRSEIEVIFGQLMCELGFLNNQISALGKTILRLRGNRWSF